MSRGIVAARWPGRLHRLGPGPLTALVPGRTVWLDGGHNPDAGKALAAHFGAAPPLNLVIGMLANKDPGAIVDPLGPVLASVTVVPVPGHDSHPPHAFAPARSAPDVATALRNLDGPGDVLIAGSLYLAGAVLASNGESPG
jgi:dihydrofolate synthase/folylpolyglutamate synthase